MGKSIPQGKDDRDSILLGNDRSQNGTYTAFLCDAEISSSVGNRQNVVPVG